MAVDGSVASGEATAINGSTASGGATAINGSTASGCSTAVNLSTASGDHCKPEAEPPCPPPSSRVVFRDGSSECIFPEGGGPSPRISGSGGASTARLALTGAGPSTAPLALAAGLALLLGTLLVTSTSDRRKAAARG